jgi:hypothetical protein
MDADLQQVYDLAKENKAPAKILHGIKLEQTRRNEGHRRKDPTEAYKFLRSVAMKTKSEAMAEEEAAKEDKPKRMTAKEAAQKRAAEKEAKRATDKPKASKPAKVPKALKAKKKEEAVPEYEIVADTSTKQAEWVEPSELPAATHTPSAAMEETEEVPIDRITPIARPELRGLVPAPISDAKLDDDLQIFNDVLVRHNAPANLVRSLKVEQERRNEGKRKTVPREVHAFIRSNVRIPQSVLDVAHSRVAHWDGDLQILYNTLLRHHAPASLLKALGEEQEQRNEGKSKGIPSEVSEFLAFNIARPPWLTDIRNKAGGGYTSSVVSGLVCA